MFIIVGGTGRVGSATAEALRLQWLTSMTSMRSVPCFDAAVALY
jgi:predicted dinucleotide-binding enzyme